MSIVSLVTGFADSLLKLQEEFSEQNRFDVLEKDAAVIQVFGSYWYVKQDFFHGSSFLS